MATVHLPGTTLLEDFEFKPHVRHLKIVCYLGSAGNLVASRSWTVARRILQSRTVRWIGSDTCERSHDGGRRAEAHSHQKANVVIPRAYSLGSFTCTTSRNGSSEHIDWESNGAWSGDERHWLINTKATALRCLKAMLSRTESSVSIPSRTAGSSSLTVFDCICTLSTVMRSWRRGLRTS